MCSYSDLERPRVRWERQGEGGRHRGREREGEGARPEHGQGGRQEVREEDLVFFLICVLYERKQIISFEKKPIKQSIS